MDKAGNGEFWKSLTVHTTWRFAIVKNQKLNK